MSKVAVVKCESYDEQAVYDAVKRTINLIGGVERFAKPKENILLKVNCLAGSAPDECVTTHPSILAAVARILQESKVNVSYGDSPGFEKPLVGLQKSGFVDVAKKYNIPLADFEAGKEVSTKNPLACDKFDIANGVLEADGMISLCKMKTHMLTRITGAVKNQFGCVYWMHKAAFHVKMPNAITFSKMLVDLNNLLKPRLFIMDGVFAMEGNGPRGGTPVKMNVIIASNDPVAVDATFCKFISLDPLIVATNKYGKISGLGDYENIEYTGDDVNQFIKKDFDVVRKSLEETSIKSRMPKVFRNALYRRPMIDPTKCIECGICVNACPVQGKALSFKDKKKPPVYDYSKCIRCYCCQEMCPQKAIYVK